MLAGATSAHSSSLEIHPEFPLRRKPLVVAKNFIVHDAG
jgi:hypothetical protein